MTLNIKIGFIGFGRMGSALAKGCVSAGTLKVAQVHVYDPSEASLKDARKNKFKVFRSEAALVEKSDLIFLAVKPHFVKGVCENLKAAMGKALRKKVFVSIAAGVGIKTLEKGLGNHVAVLRVMPNTPALLKSGISAVSRGRHATVLAQKWVKTVLDSVGETVFVNENIMDAVTAISGSGPAYVFYLAEAMIQAGGQLGLPKSLADQLVRQTIFGAGQMLKKLDAAPEDLRKQVTSPGGTTEAALKEFERFRLNKNIRVAINKAAQKSKELSN